MDPKSTHIRWHPANVSHDEREALVGQRGFVVWFTGLSGSGKSTLSRKVEELLLRSGHLAYVLDGDNLRTELNADLGFSPEDRAENIRRLGAVAKLFADSGAICLTALISPYRQDRDNARALLPDDRFLEVYVSTSLAACEARDPKGLYRKARAGEIRDFTGLDAPYEPPLAPEITLDTEALSVDESAALVLAALDRRGLIRR